jgi:DNA-binding transcriptional MerR regulator
MTERHFNVVEAAGLLGMPKRTLANWVNRKLIKPVFRAGRHRVPLKLSGKNLREAAVILGLRKAGVSKQHINRAAAYLQEAKGHNPYSKGEFLVLSKEGRKNIFKLMPEGDVIDLSRQALDDHETGQLSLFPLIHVRIELDRVDRVLQDV